MISTLRNLLKTNDVFTDAMTLANDAESKTISGIINFDWKYVCELRNIATERIQEIQYSFQKYRINISPICDLGAFIIEFWDLSTENPTMLKDPSVIRFDIKIDMSNQRNDSIVVREEPVIFRYESCDPKNNRKMYYQMDCENSDTSADQYVQLMRAEDDDSGMMEYSPESNLVRMLVAYAVYKIGSCYPPSTKNAADLEIDYTIFRSTENCCKSLYDIIPGKTPDSDKENNKLSRIIPGSFMNAILKPDIVKPDEYNFCYHTHMVSITEKGYPRIEINTVNGDMIGYLAAVGESSLAIYKYDVDSDFPEEIGHISMIDRKAANMCLVIERMFFEFVDRTITNRKNELSVTFVDIGKYSKFSNSIECFIHEWNEYVSEGWYASREIIL